MKTFIVKLIAVVLCVLLLACTLLSCSKKDDEIVINYAGSYSNAALLIMREKGIAEKYFPGMKITWTKMASSSEMRDAIVANRVTFAGISLPSYFSAVEKNLNVESICFAGDTPIKMYMRKDSNRKYQDLNSNDKIALVGMNTILHIAFLADAYNTFGDTSQFNSSFVVMPHADGLSLISSGNQISSYITTFPTTYKADQTNELVCVRDFTDVVKEYGIGSVIVVNESTSKEKREAFISAMEEAVNFIIENTDEAAQIMSADWNIPKEEIIKVLNDMPPHVKLNDYTKLVEILKEIGYLNGEY